MAENRAGSILAVDIGNIYTRAVLIDLVEGVYRLIARAEARTTNEFPAGDVRVGLRRATDEIQSVTGRKLLENNRVISPERADRSGVDTFVATTSTGRLLRTAIVGLVPDVSIASSLRAAAGTYVQIVETISLADARSEEEQLNALVSSRPDLIFITGGTEAGAKDEVLALAQLVRLVVTLMPNNKPSILYAGNSALAPAIQNLFKGLTTVFVAANVRPSVEDEELEGAQLQLALAFDERQTHRRGGFETIGEMSRLGVLPTAQSYDTIVDYLGHSYPGGVLAIDMGSAVTTLSVSLNRQVITTIRTDIGLGHSAENLLALVGEKAVEKWLPFALETNRLHHYTLNKTLRPATIPETLLGTYMEHGLLRAGIRAMLEAARPTWPVGQTGLMPPLSLIIGAGSALTRTGSPGYNALLLLDALQPTGVTALQIDPNGLIATLGALAPVNPEAVVQVLDGLSLERLGTVFNVSGQPKPNRTALKIKITTEDGNVIRHEVTGGHLWVYPLSAGQRVKVDVSAGRGLNIGGKTRLRLTVEGGSAGLIFDARGRALALGATVPARAAQMPLWISEVTGDPVQDVASAAGEELAASAVEAPVAAPKADRREKKPAREKAGSVRGRFSRRQPGAAAPVAEADSDDDTLNDINKLRG